MIDWAFERLLFIHDERKPQLFSPDVEQYLYHIVQGKINGS